MSVKDTQKDFSNSNQVVVNTREMRNIGNGLVRTRENG